jgi:signal transduction histidine kinase
MLDWFKARFRAFQASYDPDEMAAGTSPIVVAILSLGLIVTIAVVGYGSRVAPVARLQHPEVAAVITLVATAISITSWKCHCRGPVGTVAALLDNMSWSAAIIYLAVNTSQSYALGFAIAYALAVSLVTARVYGLTLLFGCVHAMPLAILVPVFRPPATVTLVLWGAFLISLMISYMTSKRQELIRRQHTLEQALSVADEVADESMQAALATMLLGLGHFLHELRNHQTAIAANLSYLETAADLSGEARDAVLDIQEAQAAEQKLLARTLDELRQRATPEIATFSLNEVLANLRAELGSEDRLTVSGSESRYQLVGNPEHLKLIVHNLVRNAIQAGASEVHLEVTIHASGNHATLTVHDNGPGISPSRRATLFEPFSSSSKIHGTGLGLYLCRRYVGLFGGTVTVGEGPLGGAAFNIQLPGRVVYRDSVLRELSKSSRAT